MDITEYFSSEYLIFLFLLFLAGIFIVLYLLKIFIPLISPGKLNINKFRKYFTLVEGIIWGMVLLGAAIFFLENNIIFSTILFLILLLLFYWYSRFALRDYIAGLVFKVENSFSLNEIIEVEGQKGIIKKFHYRNLEIENENGEMILLPYSILLGIISSPRKISDSLLSFSFEINIPSEQPYDKVSDLLKKYILSLPWIVLKNEPKIQLIEEKDNFYNVKITIFSFDESYFQSMHKRVEDFVKKNFQALKE